MTILEFPNTNWHPSQLSPEVELEVILESVDAARPRAVKLLELLFPANTPVTYRNASGEEVQAVVANPTWTTTFRPHLAVQDVKTRYVTLISIDQLITPQPLS